MKWGLKYYQGVLHPTLTTTYRSKKESKYILPNFHSKRAQELAGTLDCLRNLFQGREVHRWHQGMGISTLFYWLEEAIWKGENTEKGTPCSEHFVSITVAMIRTLSREAGMFARTYWHARIWKKSWPSTRLSGGPTLHTPGFQRRKAPAEERGRWELSHRDGANAQSQSKAAKNIKF